MFEGLKTLHVLAAILWVGGAITTQIYAIRADRSGDAGHFQLVAGEAEWVGQRFYLGASLVVLATGIAMVVKEEFLAFGDPFIVIGLGGALFSALLGSLYLGPESGRIKRLSQERGWDDPEVVRRTRTIFLLSRIELVVLVLVVVNMVVRPGSSF